MRNILLLFTGVAFAGILTAQTNNSDTSSYPFWIEMMQDPDANFYETQRAFETYWEGRERRKGDGWKVFKRWEYFIEQRIDEKGNLPAPDHVMNEYQKYFGLNSKSGGLVDEDHWQEVGPVSMPYNGTGQPNGLGRVNCLAFHPTNASLFYAGAPAGGMWKTTDGGSTWEILTDTLPTLGVSSIVLDYSNASTIYLGTGDRDSYDAPGLGVWKSTDAGDTWNPSNTGMGNRTVGKLIMNPQDSTILLAATSSGIYKSTNSGQNWARKSSNTSHYKDIVYKPGDPNIVYATARGKFYRSTNSGDTWVIVTSGLPSATRLVIGVSAANSNYVYVVLTNQRTFKGLYRSTNSGTSFSLRSSTPNIMDYAANGSGSSGQAWYDLCVAVDPLNANVLFVGGVNIWKSSDGGSSWSINTHWTFNGGVPDVHADQHDLVYSPANGRLYNGNDGGVYYTANGGNSWTEISSGLGISQIYRIGQSAQADNLVINGYQDNGTAVYDGGWRTEIGGDGMECIIDPSDSSYMYGALYYGNIRRSNNKGYNFYTVSNPITENGEWITPYLLREANSGTMLAGFKNVWRSTNIKAPSSSSVNWTRISNNAAGNAGIRVLESSPADPDVLYISREDNKLIRSDNISNASPTYTFLSGLPTNTWPKDIEAHPTDVNKVYIVQSRNVYESNNKGVSWTDISGTLPNVDMNCIVFDTSSSGNLYVGSDIGVFFKGSWMTDWIPFNGGMPATAEVTELEIYYDQNNDNSRIKAATYGRGLWTSPLYEQFNADFVANNTQICEGQIVQFTDESDGLYTDVYWEFPGGLPPTSTDENPIVIYYNAGTYDVSLKISNQYEVDSLTKTSYITVNTAPVVTVNPSTSTINLGDSVVLTASGAITYIWSPITGLNLFKGPVVVASPVTTTTYTIIGFNSNCASTGGSAEALVTVLGTGTDEFKLAGGRVRVFPNPSDKEVRVKFIGLTEGDLNLNMFDVTGKMVQSEQIPSSTGNGEVKIQTGDLKNGIYLLNISAIREKSHQVVIKLVVDHSF